MIVDAAGCVAGAAGVLRLLFMGNKAWPCAASLSGLAAWCAGACAAAPVLHDAGDRQSLLEMDSRLRGM